MLSILDLVNHYLGYFTTSSKTKGRIYTVVSAIGVWYLLYLAYRFFDNGRWLRGSIIAIMFVVLLYFTLINIIYYFTNKTVKWDVSPHIEHLMGGPHHEERSEHHQSIVVPANGLYQKQNVMTGVLSVSSLQQLNIDQLAQELQTLGLMTKDYDQLDEQEQRQIIAQRDIIFANHPGTILPYFDLIQSVDEVKVMGGVNQLKAYELGTLSMVGMTPTLQALAHYRLALSSVVMTGGMGKKATRTSLIEVNEPYQLQVEVAHEKKN